MNTKKRAVAVLAGAMLMLGAFFPMAAQAVPVTWGFDLSENTTPWADAVYLGSPDSAYGGIYGYGIGTNSLTFDFLYVENVDGADFNVYEAFGLSEFYLLDVYVGVDGSTWYQVDSTQGTPLVFDNFGPYANDPYGTPLVYSYAIPDTLASIRYIRLVGTGSNGQPLGSQGAGFDLNAVGVDPRFPVPEPGTLLLIGAGLLGVGLLRRKRS